MGVESGRRETKRRRKHNPPAFWSDQLGDMSHKWLQKRKENGSILVFRTCKNVGGGKSLLVVNVF